MVRRILELDFVEMADLLPDAWLQDESQPIVTVDGQVLSARRQPRRAPVQDVSLWIEAYSRMAAVLVTRFPDKGPELWAYQASIVRAARNFEGSAWVAYDRQYRREALARRSLNWSQANSRLYNEAFTGRAKAIPRCHHCLSDTHASSACLLNTGPSGAPDANNPRQSLGQEICRAYNAGQCRFIRCRYRHVCTECSYPHPWSRCPKNLRKEGGPGRERSRSPSKLGGKFQGRT